MFILIIMVSFHVSLLKRLNDLKGRYNPRNSSGYAAALRCFEEDIRIAYNYRLPNHVTVTRFSKLETVNNIMKLTS